MSPRAFDETPGTVVAASLAFDRIAAARGDGLLPAFRQLFAGLERLHTDAAVTDLADYLPGKDLQAGPHPRGRPDSKSAPGILPFPDNTTNRHQQRAQRKRAGKEA